jgi:hypothetical protein
MNRTFGGDNHTGVSEVMSLESVSCTSHTLAFLRLVLVDLSTTPSSFRKHYPFPCGTADMSIIINGGYPLSRIWFTYRRCGHEPYEQTKAEILDTLGIRSATRESPKCNHVRLCKAVDAMESPTVLKHQGDIHTIIRYCQWMSLFDLRSSALSTDRSLEQYVVDA